MSFRRIMAILLLLAISVLSFADTSNISYAAEDVLIAEQEESDADEAETEITQSESYEGEFSGNSWRYENGEPIQEYTKGRAASYADAWKKVDGKYMNSAGGVIQNAKLKGIDVSEWQKQINWEQVKADGIDFAIIRCGWGMDVADQDDDWWEYNVSECERLGIPYGVYLYSYADSTKRAASEAAHVLRLLKGHHPTYPVYYDMEDSSTVGVGNEMLGKIAQTFCNTVAAQGYRVGIYANLNWWKNYLTSSAFDNPFWSKWVAQYNYQCDYAGGYDMWQCTSSGQVNGVNGNADINFWTGDLLDDATLVNNGKVVYQSYVKGNGWQAAVAEGKASGTSGVSKSIEGIKIKVQNAEYEGGVTYDTYMQTYGWLGEKSDNAEAGLSGQNKRMEAIKISLTGELAEHYDIYYRVHCQTYGWLDWAKNGEAAGTSGYSKRLEAIQIQLVEKGGAAPGKTERAYVQSVLCYKSHVQTYGWQSTKVENEISGTSGLSKRMEAFQIISVDTSLKTCIEYRVHVQTYGWGDWVTGGQIAGTTGQSKRMEAIEIKLTGELAEKYDVYYRVHCQTYGWLDWAKNGESAGTEGLSKRMEAIQIQLVEKGGAAPGATTKCFVKK